MMKYLFVWWIEWTFVVVAGVELIDIIATSSECPPPSKEHHHDGTYLHSIPYSALAYALCAHKKYLEFFC